MRRASSTVKAVRSQKTSRKREPPALPLDPFVGAAGVAQLKLVGAVAREDEVGVRIHEARQDGAAAGVERGIFRHPPTIHRTVQLAFAAAPDDAPTRRRQRAFL